MSQAKITRRGVLKSGMALGAAGVAPSFFVRNAWAQDFTNNPGDASSVTLGFNVPQTGAYADEGADELRALVAAEVAASGS